MSGYPDGGLVRYWIISLRYPDMVLLFTMDGFYFVKRLCTRRLVWCTSGLLLMSRDEVTVIGMNLAVECNVI